MIQLAEKHKQNKYPLQQILPLTIAGIEIKKLDWSYFEGDVDEN